jgi:signal peptidase I
VLTVALAAVVVVFLPADLGGSTTYMTTRGTSMEPRFHTGDLAVIKPVNRYRVGDIAAYRSPKLHALVMHRIVEINGLHYVFKGDNNSWTDADRPTRADIVGKLWLHVPDGGSVLDQVHRAWVFFLAGAIFLIFGTSGIVVIGRRRRRRRDGRRAPAGTEPGRSRTATGRRRARRTPGRKTARTPGISRAARRGSKRLRVLGALQFAAAIVLAVCVAAGTFAWAHLPTEYVSAPIRYTNQGDFAYSAPVADGPVYGTKGVHTGDPVYLRVVDRLGVDFGYRFVAGVKHSISGTIALAAEVSDSSGWHQTVPLADATPFSSGRGKVHATLDLAQVQGLVAAAAGETGVRPSTQTVDVVADVQTAGRLAGRRLTDGFSPRFSFQLDPLVLKPVAAASGSTTGSSSAHPQARGSIGNTVRRSATVGVFGLEVDVTTARWVALGGALLALVVLLVVLAKRRPLHRNEVARIDARDGRIIVPVASSSPGSQRVATVDVTTMPDLVRLAERYDRLILHQARRGTHVYLFEAEGIVYRYSIKDLTLLNPGEPEEAGSVAGAVSRRS